MTIQEIEQLYGRSPQANAFLSLLEEKSVRSVFLQGLLCSSVPMFFAPLQEKMDRTVLFVLNDADSPASQRKNSLNMLSCLRRSKRIQRIFYTFLIDRVVSEKL